MLASPRSHATENLAMRLPSLALPLLLACSVTAQTVTVVDVHDSTIGVVVSQYPIYTATLAGMVRGQSFCPGTFAGLPATLLLGSTGMFLQPLPLVLGAWTVNPLLVADGLTVPATGLLVVPITVPMGWPGNTVVFGQFLMLDQALNEVQASNTFTAITR